MSAQQKRERAEDVIRMMALSDCADCLIGSELVKGISGGEKRRVSIAVQVLTEPRILMYVCFIDMNTLKTDKFQCR